MMKRTRISSLLIALMVSPFFALSAEAKCADFPQVCLVGETHP